MTAPEQVPPIVWKRLDQHAADIQRQEVELATVKEKLNTLDTNLQATRDAVKESVGEVKQAVTTMSQAMESIRMEIHKAQGAKSLATWLTPTMVGLLGLFIALKEAGVFG